MKTYQLLKDDYLLVEVRIKLFLQRKKNKTMKYSLDLFYFIGNSNEFCLKLICKSALKYLLICLF